jgi:Zn-dependent M28 family amino/carboxypeptidase
MRSAAVILIVIALTLCSCAQFSRTSVETPLLSGKRAMAHVRAQVALGPRPPGSAALQKCREYIISQMKSFGYEIEEDAFTAQTPYGPIRMNNLIARKGKGNKGVLALATHYDTKLMEGKNFVGANDGGSSTGLLIELARVLAEKNDANDYWFLFLDGEEAFVEWSTFDSTYGSRHLAQRWKMEGIVPKIRALILLDMIGDKNLDIWYETNSTKRLMDLVWGTADKNGLKSILSTTRGAVEDDHIPFLDAGVPSVDIIDLNYGPNNSYHHTLNDTLDKISSESMEKVGRLVLALLPEIKE